MEDEIKQIRQHNLDLRIRIEINRDSSEVPGIGEIAEAIAIDYPKLNMIDGSFRIVLIDGKHFWELKD